MTESVADAVLVSLLSGRTLEAGLVSSRDAVSQLIRRARYHGVLQLTLGQLIESEIPDDIKEELQRERIAQIFWEERHRELLMGIVAEFEARGIAPIFFKGTALAYATYQNPWLRTRGDTDILVAERDYPDASRILERTGLARVMAVTGDLISYQESFQSTGDIWHDHCIDLHRKVSNSEFIASRLPYDGLKELARPLDALGRGAMTPSPASALAIACIHRGVHVAVPYYVDGEAQFGGDRLIWLFDIHLLASSFETGDWTELVEMAELKGLSGPCRDGLERAQRLFGTRVPEDAMDRLNTPADPLSTYLKSGLTKRTWIDLWALPDFRARALYCRELVFPRASYMQDKYHDRGFSWLPWLYLRRCVEGLGRRLSRH